MIITMGLSDFRLTVDINGHTNILYHLPTTESPVISMIGGVGREYGMSLDRNGMCKMEEEP